MNKDVATLVRITSIWKGAMDSCLVEDIHTLIFITVVSSCTSVVLKLFGSRDTFVFQKPFAGHKN